MSVWHNKDLCVSEILPHLVRLVTRYPKSGHIPVCDQSFQLYNIKQRIFSLQKLDLSPSLNAPIVKVNL